MKKFFCFFVGLFFFGGCTTASDFVVDDLGFYQFKNAVDGGVVGYLTYPVSAKIVEGPDSVQFLYQGCVASLQQLGEKKVQEFNGIVQNYAVNSRNRDGIVQSSYFSGNKLVAYAVDKQQVKFWLYDKGIDQSGCLDFLDFLVSGFSPFPMYENQKYGFTADIFPDFKIENLPEGKGILLAKWFERSTKAKPDELIGFRVEFGVEGVENSELLPLKEFLQQRHSGAEFEFIDFNGRLGVYLNQSLPNDLAARHFYFSRTDGIVVHCFLRARREFFADYLGQFALFVEGVKF